MKDSADPPDPDAGAGAAAARDSLFVGSVDKAFRVLEAFRDRREPLGLSEIAAAAGLSKSAAQRFAHTLERLGYLEKDPRTRSLRPSLRVLSLGTGYLRAEPLVERATPLAIQAADRCGERVNVSVVDGEDLVYVIRIPRRVTSPEATMVGRRLPMPLLAGGRAILSTWPAAEAEALVRRARFVPCTPRTVTDPERILARIAAARACGFDVNDEEVLHGDIVVAAPVRDRAGRGVAAVHIAVSTVEWSAARAAERLAPLAIETANAISQDGLIK